MCLRKESINYGPKRKRKILKINPIAWVSKSSQMYYYIENYQLLHRTITTSQKRASCRPSEVCCPPFASLQSTYSPEHLRGQGANGGQMGHWSFLGPFREERLRGFFPSFQYSTAAWLLGAAKQGLRILIRNFVHRGQFYAAVAMLSRLFYSAQPTHLHPPRTKCKYLFFHLQDNVISPLLFLFDTFFSSEILLPRYFLHHNPSFPPANTQTFLKILILSAVHRPAHDARLPPCPPASAVLSKAIRTIVTRSFFLVLALVYVHPSAKSSTTESCHAASPLPPDIMTSCLHPFRLHHPGCATVLATASPNTLHDIGMTCNQSDPRSHYLVNLFLL